MTWDVFDTQKLLNRGSGNKSMDKPRHPVYDDCSLLIFVDEGCLFQKLLLHSKKLPDSTPYLMNTVFPFCGLIVHDSTRFVRDNFEPSFHLDSQSVNRLRNAAKLLSSTNLSVEEYAAEVQQIANCLNEQFKNHIGIFSNLKYSVQPDVGISYYKGKPVYTTFTISRYLAKYSSEGVAGIFDPSTAESMGYDIGQAASPSYYTVEALGIDSSMLGIQEFCLTSRDFHYSNLLKPIVEHGLSNPVYFFMLCEGLMQLNSITTLRDSEFFSDFLEIKMTTAVLVALEKSLSKLSRFAMGHAEFERDPTKTNYILSKIIPRNQRKVIKKAKKLRNALIHYDFLNYSEMKLTEATMQRQSWILQQNALSNWHQMITTLG